MTPSHPAVPTQAEAQKAINALSGNYLEPEHVRIICATLAHFAADSQPVAWATPGDIFKIGNDVVRYVRQYFTAPGVESERDVIVRGIVTGYEYIASKDDLNRTSYGAAFEDARKYQQIEPLLRELVEARGRATEGEWSTDHTCTVLHQNALGVADCDMGGNDQNFANADFIALSANTAARIAEIMKGET